MLRLLERLKLAWQMRGSVAAPLSTTAIPTAQHEMLSEDEKWKREHGFSAATSPMEATAEIAAHNKAIDEEYLAEIDFRKQLFEAGQYTPRFMCVRPGHEVPTELVGDADAVREWVLAHPGAIDINWDLELTLSPGRRHDVTKDIGKPVLPMPTEEDLKQVAEIHKARKANEALENVAIARSLGELTPDVILRQLGLDDDSIRAVAGDNDVLFQQLKAKTAEMSQELASIAAEYEEDEA